RIEVAVSPTAANQPGKLNGTIVGVQLQKATVGAAVVDVEVLNMWCADGMRSIKLSDVQSLRFSNPVIESEFRRALDVLALSHDSQKKSVSLHFAGEGKRKVQVGYVIEAPIWKTSYRLVIKDNEKPYLQGWAMVENPTDEDWTGVKMALISGRPISFKMDLYNPLYINRPIVEPELFASLRPVTYRGNMNGRQLVNFSTGVFGSEGGAPVPTPSAGPPGAVATYGAITAPSAGQPGSTSTAPKRMGVDFSTPALGPLPLALDASVPLVTTNDPVAVQLERKRYAADVGQQLAGRMLTGSVGNAATAGSLGDFFQYVIDHPVTLARQKSALLPIVGKDIEGTRVSIYNP
ncbi:MAG: DUF4139 domain-containing protein, partial [Planctomycetia bacterium]|nr:DUF4139 domain-containing protein [Planctomycetia bacterium]